MLFNPLMIIKNRAGDPCMGFNPGDMMTVGALAIKSLDNIARGDSDRLLRQFRISSQIQDAMERTTCINMPKDEVTLIMEVVREMATSRIQPDGVLIYGRFCELLDEMKEASKEAKPNGASKPTPEGIAPHRSA